MGRSIYETKSDDLKIIEEQFNIEKMKEDAKSQRQNRRLNFVSEIMRQDFYKLLFSTPAIILILIISFQFGFDCNHPEFYKKSLVEKIVFSD